MSVHPHAGALPLPEMLVHLPSLMSSYYTESPTPSLPQQRISFGTSGHRGTSLKRSFNEAHIYAVTQAVCDVRKKNGIQGPLFIGMDTHALSEAAYRSALEVLVANAVQVRVARGGGFTPTPVISHAILSWNRNNDCSQADGIVITPSHNPPHDGGFKYNPPHAGPAESAVTKAIEDRANELLENNNREVRRMPLERALRSAGLQEIDMQRAYVEDLTNVLDMEAIATSGVRLGVHPLGGASLSYWEPIAEHYKLNLTMVNKECDPSFRFVPCDRDGKIRMDCSSAYAMSALLREREGYDLAFGCDPDADRHGIVTARGLMNPNHYLAAAASHLCNSRSDWSHSMGIGKTLVTSSMLDRVGLSLHRKVVEVPVGFKWFVPYLHDGTVGFACEESAGASFLRFDGTPWSTDKDGLLLCLLAAEMTAKGNAPDVLYGQLVQEFGEAFYERIDFPANEQIRSTLLALTPEQVSITESGGEAIEHVLTRAPGNDASIGGVKVSTKNGWFAIRPSGTEDICKVYAESFVSKEHLQQLQNDAGALLKMLVH